MSDPRDSSQARLLAVLDLFNDQRLFWTPDDISAALGVSRPTGYRYVRHLTEFGLLQRVHDGQVTLGPRIIVLDHYIRHADPVLQVGVPFMRELRHAVGLRPLSSTSASGAAPSSAASDKTLDLSFKQYREADGRFYFKLVDASGQVWLQSLGFDNPRDAGQGIRRLQQEGSAALPDLQAQLQSADLAAVGQVLDAWRERIQLAAAQQAK